MAANKTPIFSTFLECTNANDVRLGLSSHIFFPHLYFICFGVCQQDDGILYPFHVFHNVCGVLGFKVYILGSLKVL